jgi:serine/threonine protein kinase
LSLTPNSRFGRFVIGPLLGRGGMGEVYRARDSRLDRDVAIKVLPATLHADSAAVARFEQEARAASALSHPAILTVFDAGTEHGQPYLVTELLEGDTLRARLDRGPLPLREALDLAVRVAGGLGAAHLAGIVHRDIKPENLFVTRGGDVKILDFGVARLGASPGAADAAVTAPGTAAGMLVGTPGYMAPEQARGSAVDGRADVFALGCVLYEVLAGQRAFGRATPIDTIAAVVTEAPPPLPAGRSVPPGVARILARCLEKDPAARFQSAADLAFALAGARDGLDAPTSPRAATSLPDRALRWAAVTALVGSAALVLASWRAPGALPAPPSVSARSVVPSSAKPMGPALSPDGKWVAYVSVAGRAPQLLVQFLNGGVPVNLSEGNDIPVLNRTLVGGLDIAPDGTAIGFAGRPLAFGVWSIPGAWIIPAPLGGPARRVTDRFASIRWSPDGQQLAAVVANPIAGDAIAVSDLDGRNERVVVPAGGGLHRHQVAWSPDGRYIYYAQTLDPNHTASAIHRVPVAGGAPEAVVTEGVAMYPAPTPDGRALVYAGDHGGEGLNLWWRPLGGGPERRLTAGAGEYTEPSIARDGRTLSCLARRRRGELVRIGVDQPGTASVEAIGEPGSGDSDPSIAPGSDRVYISSPRSGRRKIWALDATGARPAPLTSGDALDQGPVVSPDGRVVAFLSNREGQRGLWVVPAGGGAPRRVLTGAVTDRVSWSPDSRRLVYALAGDLETTLWVVEAAGGAPERIPGAAGRAPAWSPAGDLIALVRADGDRAAVHFITSAGARARPPLLIDPVGLPTALAWSPDGRRLALINLPGRAAAEVWVLSVEDGSLREVTEFPAPAELEGITWTADGRAVIVGRTDYETEVLLLTGIRPD